MGLNINPGEKPKLLIILNRFVIGGQAVDTIPLAYALKDDFDILILYGEKEKDEIEPGFLLERYPGLRLKKISRLRRSINPFTDLFAFFSLYKAISHFKANIVHTHGAKSGFLGRLAAFIAGVPVIIHTFHGHFFHSYFSSTISRLVAWIEKMAGKITTAAIALSATQKNDLSVKYKVLPAEKIKVIPLGFEYQSLHSALELSRQFRSRYGLQHNDVAIGIVGRIVPVKNHSLFLKVINSYQHQHPQSPAAFFIIGDGELKLHLQKELKRMGIEFTHDKIDPEKRVLFTSWLQEMDVVMSGLDIVMLTSLNEGTPLSMIEAQYFKKPVISTNVGGVKDTMLDGETGFLVDENNLAALVEKLHLLVENKALRTQMGEAANAFILQKFSKSKEVNITKEFYFSLLRQKGFRH